MALLTLGSCSKANSPYLTISCWAKVPSGISVGSRGNLFRLLSIGDSQFNQFGGGTTLQLFTNQSSGHYNHNYSQYNSVYMEVASPYVFDIGDYRANVGGLTWETTDPSLFGASWSVGSSAGCTSHSALAVGKWAHIFASVDTSADTVAESDSSITGGTKYSFCINGVTPANPPAFSGSYPETGQAAPAPDPVYSDNQFFTLESNFTTGTDYPGQNWVKPALGQAFPVFNVIDQQSTFKQCGSHYFRFGGSDYTWWLQSAPGHAIDWNGKTIGVPMQSADVSGPSGNPEYYQDFNKNPIQIADMQVWLGRYIAPTSLNMAKFGAFDVNGKWRPVKPKFAQDAFGPSDILFTGSTLTTPPFTENQGALGSFTDTGTITEVADDR